MVERDPLVEHEAVTTPMGAAALLEVPEDAALELPDVLEPALSMTADAFSQRMPPVQYITSVFDLYSSGMDPIASGKALNEGMSSATAPSKVPTLVS